MLKPTVGRIAPVAVLLAVAACAPASRSGRAATAHAPSTTEGSGSAPTHGPTTTATTTTTTTTTIRPTPSGTITSVTASDLPATYRSGCPVAPASLRMLHMSYWGFDDRPHLGTMVVNAAVTQPVLTVFATLFRDHFPIRRMLPVDAFGGSDPASMAADNTSAFNCRDAVATGPPRWSVHAYGEAIDVDPVENPYLEGGRIQPPAGVAFVDRGRARPGMAAPGTQLNDAFASVGWLWGGRWTSAPDYQHFSKTGG